MTATTTQRSQTATTGRYATWVFAIGLVIAFVGVVVMSADAVFFGAIVAVVGLVVAAVCAGLTMFGKR